ncbi:MAG: hypothetical protein ACOY0T_22685 [Myxococcota bacterium]
MDNLSKTRWGAALRLIGGAAALTLCVLPFLANVRSTLSNVWQRRTDYYIAAAAVALLALVAPHFLMKASTLRLQRGLGTALCLTAAIAALVMLALTAILRL